VIGHLRLPHPPRMLRGRLIGLLALALILGFAAAALTMVLLVKHVLVGRLDAQLRAAGDRFSVSLELGDRDGDDKYRQTEGQLAGTLGARLKGGKVTNAAIVADDQTSDQVPTQAQARLAAFTRPGGPVTVRLAGLGDYRIVITAGRDDDLQITGLPAEPIEHTTDVLVLVVVGVFAVTLLILVGVSTALVRVMLRPLARMSATAADVADLPLGSGGVSLPNRVDEGPAGSEVDLLARAFNAMLQQVESALHTRADSEERLRRFIADASHELRTPIAVIRSHAELARREGGSNLPEGVARSLERISAQSERMGHLVEDLLLLARLDSGKPLADEPVDVVRLALDAVDDARTAAPSHQWRLALPEDPVTVPGDAQAMAQVLSNLLANVAAHTPAGTTATLRVEQVGADTTIEVRDDGPGMAAELAGRAFDRFVHGARTQVMTSGSSGLGLPIVAAIVAAHAGTVTLTSTETGTSVIIRLPVGAPNE
jgi:two-component system OmpR family sensor kinase